MPGPLSGPQVGLPIPQYLYPSELNNAPLDESTNRLALAPGQALAIRRGDWLVDPGMYSVLQFLDPVNNTWVSGVAAGWKGGVTHVSSDGFNVRIANMLGCPVGASVVNGGGSYVQASTTITPSVGNSTWSPIVGGALSLSTISAPGLNYGVAPLVLIPAPPGPTTNSNSVGGVAAAAYATLTGASVSAISFESQGAGYNSAPTAVVVPSPYDPNLNSGITSASIALALTGAGTITGALCTNPGAPLTNAQIAAGLTLTVGGAGSTASVSAIIPQTIVGLTTISTVGAGYGTSGATILTFGGVPQASALTTPTKLLNSFRPRQPNINLATNTSVVSLSAIYDGGYFVAAPTPIVVPSGTTQAVVSVTMGSVADHVILQQLA